MQVYDIKAEFIPVNFNKPATLTTKTITSNGYYEASADNADGYSSVTVVVPEKGPVQYIAKKTNNDGKLINDSNIINLDGATDVGDYVLNHAYYTVTFPENTSLDLSSLTTISGTGACIDAFTQTRNIVSVDLSGLKTITGSSACQCMFYSCFDLASINISSLETISNANALYQAFSGTALVNVDFASLTTHNSTYGFDGAFQNCTSLKTVSFNKLNVINNPFGASGYNQVFEGCKKLESVLFGGVTASTFSGGNWAFVGLFNNTTGSEAPNGCTVHFPSNLDPNNPSHTFDITTLRNYPTFGGNANYIHLAFDLPATE